MAASWHLAPSLVQLRAEINRRWPGRDKTSDGSIGDAAHSSRVSDHNPNARRSVNALDIDRDGIDVEALRALLIKDSRVYYVIYNRRIWQRKYGFAPRTYTGPSPHTGHLHVSIIQSVAAEQDTRPWGIDRIGGSSGAIKPPTTPTSGGLTVSDINAILARLDKIDAGIAGKNGTNDKLMAVAAGTYSRAALNERNAAVASIVKSAVNASTAAILAAVGKTGALSAADLAAVQEAAEKGVTEAIDGATLQLKAGA